MTSDSAHDQDGKHTFDDIYDMPDPRPYYRVLMRHDYLIPHHAQPVFARLVAARRARSGQQVAVTDLCCSYGVNAALLKHDLTLPDLYQRYRSDDVDAYTSDELADHDAAFYARHRRPDPPRVVGLDMAANAVAYARRAGLLDAGWSENLEEGTPSEGLRADVRDTEILTVTGGVGYIGVRTFSAVLSAVQTTDPWVAAFVLRWVDFEPIIEVLAHHGLVTEHLSARTFPQRQFADDTERDYVLGVLAERGIDPTGKEAEGSHHTDFYLARPKEEVEDTPLDAWLGGAAGDEPPKAC